jgi:hypothetical protein
MANQDQPRESAIDIAKSLRDDLEAIADSDIPFSYDAEQILNQLDQAQSDEKQVEDGTQGGD